MTREIKFRGLRKEGNNMREIHFRAWDKSNSYMITMENYNPEEYFFQFDNFGNIEVYGANLPSSYPDIGIGYDKLDDVIIMQYIGIKDTKGKKIYEGDLVFDEDGEYSKTCIIEWSNDNAKFFGISVFDDEVYDMDEICGEVIGNIYENPELLK